MFGAPRTDRLNQRGWYCVIGQDPSGTSTAVVPADMFKLSPCPGSGPRGLYWRGLCWRGLYCRDVDFDGDDNVEHGVRTRAFHLRNASGNVPGMLWTPLDAGGSRPLVLIGHGASGHKSEDYVTAVARRLVRSSGFAAASIDGPVHGERAPVGVVDPGHVMMVFAKQWGSNPDLTDEVVADWRAVISALRALPDVGEGPLGYWGLSMGTIFGLPLLAAEPRFGAAVLGLMGRTGPTEKRLVESASKVDCPVLFLAQWDDELFRRDSVIELFDAIASRDKTLHANLGRHAEVPPREFDDTLRFLSSQLSPTGKTK